MDYIEKYLDEVKKIVDGLDRSVIDKMVMLLAEVR